MENNLSILHNKLFEMLKDLDFFCKNNSIDYTLAYGSVLGAVRHNGFIPWDDDLDIYMTPENYNKFLEVFENNDMYFLQRDTIDYPLQFSKLRCNNTTFIEKIVYKKKYKNIHQGVYIDIFCLEKLSKNKFQKSLQIFFSNILLCQSLFIRGYQTKSILKHVCMFLSACFIPVRLFMISYMRKFNIVADFDYYCCLADRNHSFLNREMFTKPFSFLTFESSSFPVPNNYTLYLEKIYGNYIKLPSEKEINKSIHAKIFSVSESYKNFIKD